MDGNASGIELGVEFGAKYIERPEAGEESGGEESGGEESSPTIDPKWRTFTSISYGITQFFTILTFCYMSELLFAAAAAYGIGHGCMIKAGFRSKGSHWSIAIPFVAIYGACVALFIIYGYEEVPLVLLVLCPAYFITAVGVTWRMAVIVRHYHAPWRPLCAFIGFFISMVTDALLISSKYILKYDLGFGSNLMMIIMTLYVVVLVFVSFIDEK